MIVIIGGGISGLYAATKLIGKEPITILEKSHRLGGCIHTHYEKDFSYETGAGRFNKHHKLLLQLLKEYGLTPVIINALSSHSEVGSANALSSHSEVGSANALSSQSEVGSATKKTYKPILCKTNTATLQTVLDYANEVPVKILKSITFLQLCNTAVGYNKAQYLMKSFGYNAEFEIANAYASIKIFTEDFKDDVEYYYCKEGLTELVKRMEERLINNGVTILKNYNVTDISKDLVVNNTIKGSKLILAVPKETLTTLPLFTQEDIKILNTVTGVTLHRIYAKYKEPWFSNISRTTTDLSLRQFIPVNKKNGLAMVSYSDTRDADYWFTYKKAGLLEKELKKQLELVFPKKKIPKNEWIRSYYWKNAVHVWNAGIDPVKIQKKIQNLYPNVVIVGESYSLRHGWIEGALESVNKNLKILKSR